MPISPEDGETSPMQSPLCCGQLYVEKSQSHVNAPSRLLADVVTYLQASVSDEPFCPNTSITPLIFSCRGKSLQRQVRMQLQKYRNQQG